MEISGWNSLLEEFGVDALDKALGTHFLDNETARRVASVVITEYPVGSPVEFIDDPNTKRQSLSLTTAIMYRDLEVIQMLVECGASLSITRGLVYQTPLNIAIANGRDDVALYLMDRGALFDETSFRCCLVTDSVEVARSMLERGFDNDENGGRPMDFGDIARRAVINGASEILQQILLPRVDALTVVDEERGDSLLHLACRSASARSLEILLQARPDISLPNDDGDTPLHLACGRHDKDILDYSHSDIRNFVFMKSSDIDVLDGHDDPWMEVEVDYGKLLVDAHDFFFDLYQYTEICKMIESLLSAGSDVNAVNNAGDTPFLVAVELFVHVDQAERLCPLGIGHPVALEKSSYRRPTIFQAREYWKHRNRTVLDRIQLEPMMQMLLDGGADCMAIGRLGYSALHLLVTVDCPETMAILHKMDSKCRYMDWNHFSSLGKTALDIALENNCLRVAEFLRSRGGKNGVNDPGDNSLLY